MKTDLLVITGPTATGKTALAAAVCAAIGGEVISADSRQVYRGMDIGTGKDYEDYLSAGVSVPYHLIDIADPGYKYNVFEYQRDFLKVYEDIRNRNRFPVLCGGTGLYIDAVTSGYRMIEVPPDEALRKSLEEKSMEELKGILNSYRAFHNITDFDSKKRLIRAIEIEHHSGKRGEGESGFPVIKPLIVGISIERELRRQRISERLIARLENGMVEEVRSLLDKGIEPEALIYYGLEYKYITLYLTGALSYESMINELEIAIHQYAKRQMTWFRGMERKGTIINWIDGTLPMDRKVAVITDLIKKE